MFDPITLMKYATSLFRTNGTEAFKAVYSLIKLPKMSDLVQLFPPRTRRIFTRAPASQPESGSAHNVRTYTEPTQNSESTCDKNTSSEHSRNDSPNCLPSVSSSHRDANKSIINDSSILLSATIESLLNKGPNFSILHRKLDLTQV